MLRLLILQAPSTWFYQNKWIAFPTSKGLAHCLSSSQFSAGIWTLKFLDSASELTKSDIDEAWAKVDVQSKSTHQKLNPYFLSPHDVKFFGFEKIIVATSKLMSSVQEFWLPVSARGMTPWLGWIQCDADLECEVRLSNEVQASQAAPHPS